MARLVEHSPQTWSDPRHGSIAAAIRALRAEGRAVSTDLLLRLLAGDEPGAALFLGTLPDAALPLDLAELEARSVWEACQIRRSRAVFGDALTSLEAATRQADSIILNARKALENLDGETSLNGLPPIVDATEFLVENIIPPRELIYGLLHQGLILIHKYG